MYQFYLFTLISSLGLIVLWQTFGERKSLNRFFGTIFLIMIIAYALSLFQLHLRDYYSLKILFRDLILMSFLSFLSVVARKSSVTKLLWITISGIGLFFFANQRNIFIPKDYLLDEDAELIIKLNDGDISDDLALLDFLKKQNIIYAKAFKISSPEITELDHYYLLDLKKNNGVYINRIKEKLSTFSEIEVIEENEEVYLSPIMVEENRISERQIKFNDPLNKEQWALEVLNLEALNGLLLENLSSNKKAKLFILDTGVDATHEDIKDNYLSLHTKYDTDKQSHGTHCAGIAGAVTNNGIGISSMALNNQLFTVTGIKVLNDMGMGSQKTIINGIIEAAENGADVISLSLGGRSTDSRQKAYEETVKYANDLGAIVIVAAGNSNMNAKDYAPANAKGVIAVSAVNEQLEKAEFSNTVDDLEMGIAAPGVNITSTIPGNQYKAFNGTSMATPFVSGLVAILKSFQPDLTTQQVYDLINDNGKGLKQSRTGNLIDPYNTLKNLMREKEPVN